MIVRERPDAFIMIEQDNHAHISGEIISHWLDDFFVGEKYRKSVTDAIYMHDLGWKAFDQQPFWNDEKQAPYTFINFPVQTKAVLYKHGFDAVAQQDLYAAWLCSEHYTRFMLHEDADEAQAFVKREKKRQQQIIAALPTFDYSLFDFHYGLLQICDNLSLYMCLNEPNVTKEDVHPFFHDGIPLSPSLHVFDHSKMQLDWRSMETIAIHPFPFASPPHVTLKQKTVTKRSIMDKGLNKAYQSYPYEEVNIQLIAGD